MTIKAIITKLISITNSFSFNDNIETFNKKNIVAKILIDKLEKEIK